MKPVIEMRTYRTLPGRREEFLKIFRSRSMPAHEQLGMKIVGPFPSLEDPDVFFFMRAFPEASRRDEMKRRFYEGTLWKNELEQVLMPMLAKYESVLVEDTQRLFEPWSEKS